MKYTFTCKYLSRPSKDFMTGTDDDFSIPETSYNDCFRCDYANCNLYGRCDLCIHSSECDNHVNCFSDDLFYDGSDDDLPF